MDSTLVLTKDDLEIIAALRGAARRSFREIAKIVSQPESTVRHKVTRLVESQLISLDVVPNPQALGYNVWVCVGLHVDMKHVKTIVESLSRLNEVYFLALSAGEYDVILNAVFRDNDDLLTFLTKHIPAIDGIKNVSTHIFLDVVKRELSIMPPEVK